jgi:hypothetical protein
VKKTQDIQNRLDFIYKSQIDYAQKQDISDEKLLSRIIEMHYNLNQAIKVLDDVIETSQQICNDQAR